MTLRVVTADEESGAIALIEPLELRTAATRAGDNRIEFADMPPRRVESVVSLMGTDRPQDFEVAGVVVPLVTIGVVDNLAASQQSTDLLHRDEAVLVYVTPRIRERVARAAQQHVPVRCDYATTAPVWIPLSAVDDSHGIRIAQG